MFVFVCMFFHSSFIILPAMLVLWFLFIVVTVTVLLLTAHSSHCIMLAVIHHGWPL